MAKLAYQTRPRARSPRVRPRSVALHARRTVSSVPTAQHALFTCRIQSCARRRHIHNLHPRAEIFPSEAAALAALVVELFLARRDVCPDLGVGFPRTVCWRRSNQDANGLCEGIPVSARQLQTVATQPQPSSIPSAASAISSAGSVRKFAAFLYTPASTKLSISAR